jgi:hypothetical protein
MHVSKATSNAPGYDIKVQMGLIAVLKLLYCFGVVPHTCLGCRQNFWVIFVNGSNDMSALLHKLLQFTLVLLYVGMN